MKYNDLKKIVVEKKGDMANQTFLLQEKKGLTEKEGLYGILNLRMQNKRMTIIRN